VEIAVACKCLVLRSGVPVHTLVPLKCIVACWNVLDEAVEEFPPIGVWLRVQVQNVLRHRVDLVLAIDIVLSIAGQGCRAARAWLIKLDRAIRASQGRVQQFGKIALPHQQSWYGIHASLAYGDAVHFQVSEIEEFVFQNWEAERRAKLVLMIGRSSKCIPVDCIKTCIAEILPYAAMNLIAARLDAGAQNRARRMPEFRAVIAGLQAETQTARPAEGA